VINIFHFDLLKKIVITTTSSIYQPHAFSCLDFGYSSGFYDQKKVMLQSIFWWVVGASAGQNLKNRSKPAELDGPKYAGSGRAV
jgi:hypothetical protein